MQNHDPHTIYRGFRGPGGASITVETGGNASELPPRLDLRNHSPSGLEWGYHGSGPGQAALAILAHATGNDRYAELRYQEFKREVIAHIGDSQWTIPLARILEWAWEHPLEDKIPEPGAPEERWAEDMVFYGAEYDGLLPPDEPFGEDY